MTTSREINIRDLMQKTIDTLADENERLRVELDIAIAIKKCWKANAESLAEAAKENNKYLEELEAGQSATASLERWRDEQG